MQKNKFFEIVNHAYNNIPMYKRIAEQKEFNVSNAVECNDRTNIPLMEKKDFLYTDDIFFDEKKYDCTKISRAHSSGSTGKCLFIYNLQTELNRSLSNLWIYRKKWYNINTTDKVCMFNSIKNTNTLDNQGILYKTDNNRALSIYKNNLSTENIDKVYNMIMNFNPIWMIMQPSMAMFLAEYIMSHNLKSFQNLKYIELTGENLLKYTKVYIENIFKCTVANQYGCEEVQSIAYECPNGHLHILKNNVDLEILDDNQNSVEDGEKGNIYITGLNNKFMPFVRYKIDDIGRIVDGIECEYNSAGKVIDILNAKTSENIILKDGRKISPYIFSEVIECINERCYGGIIQFQIEQITYVNFIVRIVINKKKINDSSEALDTLAKIFIDLISINLPTDCEFEFEFFDNLLPDKLTAKMKNFISRLNYED